MILRYIKGSRSSGKGNGLKSVPIREGVSDKNYRSGALPDIFKDMGSHAGSQGDRLIREMVRRILISDGCKMEELEELFHYSRSSMSRITTLSNSYLENFGLELFSKAYTGLYISGNEISIRDCMYHLLEKAGMKRSGTLWTSGKYQEKDIQKMDRQMPKKIRNIRKGKRKNNSFQIPGHHHQANLSRKGDLFRLSGSSGRKRTV